MMSGQLSTKQVLVVFTQEKILYRTDVVLQGFKYVADTQSRCPTSVCQFLRLSCSRGRVGLWGQAVSGVRMSLSIVWSRVKAILKLKNTQPRKDKAEDNPSPNDNEYECIGQLAHPEQ